MTSFFQKSNSILPYLFNHLNISYNAWYLDDLINAQSDSKSLSGIINILNNYQVETLSIKLNSSDLKQLDVPFVTQLCNDKNEIVFVVEINDNTIRYINEVGKTITESFDDFLKFWSGVALLIEKTDNSHEKDYKEHLNKQYLYSLRIPFVIISSIAVLIYFFSQNINQFKVPVFPIVILFVFLTLGSIISILLLILSIDKNNVLINKLCSTISGSHCNDILKSKASRLLGLVSWSEIGCVFFIGYLLNIVFLPDSLSFMFLLTICCLPYTFWSVFYQWKVAKRFCLLCISIQILLWAIFFVNLYLEVPIAINTRTFISSISCFILPSIILYFFIPFIVESRKVTPLTHKLHKLLTNKDIFQASLRMQPQFSFNESVEKITFGNPDASIVLTIITNPFCEPCGHMHVEIGRLLSMYRDDLAVRIIYAVDSTDNSDRNTAIKHLIAVFFQYDSLQVENIYMDWFLGGKADLELFAGKFSVNINDEVVNMFNSHKEWCLSENIAYTPMLIVNNHQIPPWYSIENLDCFIRL